MAPKMTSDDNTAAVDTEQAILQLAREEPELGQAAVAARLRRSGMRISASGVRYLWQKHGLETAAKRLQALMRDSDRGLAALSDGQRRLLERATLSAQAARGPSGGETGPHDEPLDRRQVILNAAAELFSEQGYDRASIRDIANKAGLLAGSVYHHFASKDELYLAVHREGFHDVMEAVQRAVDSASDPWERLTRACGVHVHLIVGGSPVHRVTGHSLALIGHDTLLAKIRPVRDDYEDLYRGLIDALPVAPGTDRSLLRLTLLGAMNWVYLWYREGRRSPQEIAATMVEMLRSGTAPR